MVARLNRVVIDCGPCACPGSKLIDLSGSFFTCFSLLASGAKGCGGEVHRVLPHVSKQYCQISETACITTRDPTYVTIFAVVVACGNELVGQLAANVK